MKTIFITILENSIVEIVHNFIQEMVYISKHSHTNSKYEQNIQDKNYITYAVDITNEEHIGALYIQIHYPDAKALLHNLLEDPEKEDIDDCIGEILNMYSGKVRSVLEEQIATIPPFTGGTPYHARAMLHPSTIIECKTPNSTFYIGYSLPNFL